MQSAWKERCLTKVGRGILKEVCNGAQERQIKTRRRGKKFEFMRGTPMGARKRVIKEHGRAKGGEARDFGGKRSGLAEILWAGFDTI